MQKRIKQILILSSLILLKVIAFGYDANVPLEVIRHRAKTQSLQNKKLTTKHPRSQLKIHFPKLRKQKTHRHKRIRRHRSSGLWVYSGSLRHNIKRIAAHYGWHQVIWNVPNDYEWVGSTHFQEKSLVIIFKKLLADYPLQANFYKGNHVLVIVPRTLKCV